MYGLDVTDRRDSKMHPFRLGGGGGRLDVPNQSNGFEASSANVTSNGNHVHLKRVRARG